MSKFTNSKIVFWGIVAIGVVVGLLVIALLKNTEQISYKEYQDEIVTECRGSDVKLGSEGEVFTCIDGKWIYTGKSNNSKE